MSSSQPTSGQAKIQAFIIGLDAAMPLPGDADFKGLMQAEMTKFASTNITPHIFLVDPTAEGLIEKLNDRLQGQKYDCIAIGNGIRGNGQYTAAFEQLINVCLESQPGAKFAFPVWLDDVVSSIQRVTK